MTEFEYFRDRYCGHQSANLQFDTDDEAVPACSFKDEIHAAGWDYWQKCTLANCPFFQKFEVKWKK